MRVVGIHLYRLLVELSSFILMSMKPRQFTFISQVFGIPQHLILGSHDPNLFASCDLDSFSGKRLVHQKNFCLIVFVAYYVNNGGCDPPLRNLLQVPKSVAFCCLFVGVLTIGGSGNGKPLFFDFLHPRIQGSIHLSLYGLILQHLFLVPQNIVAMPLVVSSIHGCFDSFQGSRDNGCC